MIRTECVVFAAMFAAGFLAGMTANLLLWLGTASRLSRAIFDFLTPLAVGAIFFFGLQLGAGGVFRFYALVAFAGGALSERTFFRRLSPKLRRLAKRMILPIKSLDERAENAVKRRLSPIENRLRARREKRREERMRARLSREEERAKKAAEAKEMREIRRRKAASARSERSKAKARAGAPSAKVIDKSRPARYNKQKNLLRRRYDGDKVSDAGAALAGLRSEGRAARHIDRV